MTTYRTLSTRTDDRGVTYITLNRAEKRNALSSEMITELTDIAQSLGAVAETRAVVLTGAGRIFCAGGDLEWMQAQMAADRPTRIKEARKLAQMLRALNEMPAPLIGGVHGGAFGGGVGLICVCDYVVADAACKFGLTETRLGLIPATIGPYVISRLGEGLARRIFMSSRIFDSAEALSLGVIAEVCTSGELEKRVEAQVIPYLDVAPGAAGAAKSLARSLGPKIDDDIIDKTIERLADIWEGDEAAEGIEAFFQQRPARWMLKT